VLPESVGDGLALQFVELGVAPTMGERRSILGESSNYFKTRVIHQKKGKFSLRRLQAGVDWDGEGI
jgi:hypothetical protein